MGSACCCQHAKFETRLKVTGPIFSNLHLLLRKYEINPV